MHLSRRVRPAVLAFALAAVVPFVLRAQEPATSAGDSVHLDVVVTDTAGRPLTGLVAADFEVREGDQLQSLEGVAFVSRPASAGDAGDARPVRVFGILLDEFHVDPAHTARVRDSLRQFVARDLRPDDVVVVVKPLDSLSGLQPASGRAALEERIETFEGRRGDFEPRTPFEEATMSRAPAAAAPERARVVLSALATLTRRLGTLADGRAALLFVSEGFADVAPRGRSRTPGLQAILETASRGGVVVYAINPRPASSAADADDPAGSLLVTLTTETGGASVAGDRMAEGLAMAARDLDGYYRLAYRPTNPAYGRHPVDVRVRRTGAQVRALTTRWAVPPPAEAADASAATFSSTRPPLRPQQISPLIDTWFGSARGAEGRTRMTFSWEPRTRAQSAAAWLTFTAVTSDGAVLFDGRVDPVRSVGVGGRTTLTAEFETAPGFVHIDMTIRDSAGARLGTDSRDVRVPDLHAPDVVLSTPVIIRTFNALQFRTLSTDPAAPPAVSRRFSRNERLLVRVHAYPVGDASGPRPEVTARLVGRGTATLRELTPLPNSPGDALVQFDLPLASFPSGEYGIEIHAGNRRELVLFDISN